MKNTLLIFGLLWALGASGQGIYIDSYRFGGAPAAGLLLDDYPGAVRAYSLRLIRTAYTGNCVEVRRSSDNTTSNIGFSGGVLDTTTLKTFCASTDCFVRTWYDQSTSASNATQTSTTLQPQIVSSGAIIRLNGEPAMSLDGTDDHLLLASGVTGTSSQSDFSVAGRTTTGINTMVNGSTLSIYGVNHITTSNALYFRNSSTSAATSGTTTETGQILLGCVYTSNSISYNVNGTNYTSSYTFGTGNAFLAIGRRSTIYHSGAIQETIIYSSDQSSNRTGIENNINSFYNAY